MGCPRGGDGSHVAALPPGRPSLWRLSAGASLEAGGCRLQTSHRPAPLLAAPPRPAQRINIAAAWDQARAGCAGQGWLGWLARLAGRGPSAPRAMAAGPARPRPAHDSESARSEARGLATPAASMLRATTPQRNVRFGPPVDGTEQTRRPTVDGIEKKSMVRHAASRMRSGPLVAAARVAQEGASRGAATPVPSTSPPGRSVRSKEDGLSCRRPAAPRRARVDGGVSRSRAEASGAASARGAGAGRGGRAVLPLPPALKSPGGTALRCVASRPGGLGGSGVEVSGGVIGRRIQHSPFTSNARALRGLWWLSVRPCSEALRCGV